MTKITKEGWRILSDWEEDTIQAIQDSLSSWSSNTSDEDREAAEGIFGTLAFEGFLAFPELPDPEPNIEDTTFTGEVY